MSIIIERNKLHEGCRICCAAELDGIREDIEKRQKTHTKNSVQSQSPKLIYFGLLPGDGERNSSKSFCKSLQTLVMRGRMRTHASGVPQQPTLTENKPLFCIHDLTASSIFIKMKKKKIGLLEHNFITLHKNNILNPAQGESILVRKEK